MGFKEESKCLCGPLGGQDKDGDPGFPEGDTKHLLGTGTVLGLGKQK